MTNDNQTQDRLTTMQSGNRIPQCTWVTVDRCCLPAPGNMTGQSARCQWHLYWNEMCDRARTLEERIERPAFDDWWEWRTNTYKTNTSWGLNKEEYWHYVHGQAIHDQDQEAPPAIQSEPGHLSREEFGNDLFDAIKAQGAVVQALKAVEIYNANGLDKKAREYEEHARAESVKLQTILERNTIHPEDLRRLLSIS